MYNSSAHQNEIFCPLKLELHMHVFVYPSSRTRKPPRCQLPVVRFIQGRVYSEHRTLSQLDTKACCQWCEKEKQRKYVYFMKKTKVSMWLMRVLYIAKQTQRAKQSCNNNEIFGENRSKMMILNEFSFYFRFYALYQKISGVESYECFSICNFF